MKSATSFVSPSIVGNSGLAACALVPCCGCALPSRMLPAAVAPRTSPLRLTRIQPVSILAPGRQGHQRGIRCDVGVTAAAPQAQELARLGGNLQTAPFVNSASIFKPERLWRERASTPVARALQTSNGLDILVSKF